MLGTERRIGPWGTIARTAGGLALIYLAVTEFGDPAFELGWPDAALGLGLFPAVTVAFGLAVRLSLGDDRQLDAMGHIGLCAGTALAVVLFTMTATRDAAALFFGSALLIAAARGYAGCEVLTVSNWLLKREDQVACVVFSPIDEIESRLAGRQEIGHANKHN